MSEEYIAPVVSVLSSLGASAGIAAIVSSIVNYIMTSREFRKKSYASLIEQRLNVYSAMIYHLDSMRYKHKALSYTQRRDTIGQERYAYSEEEWKDTIRRIDDKLGDNYYLVEHDILELWIWVKTLFVHPFAIKLMPDLRNRLIESYNRIAKQHEKILGVGVAMIHQKELDIITNYHDSVTIHEEQTLNGTVVDSESKESITGVKMVIQIIDNKNNVVTEENIMSGDSGEFTFKWSADTKFVGEHDFIIHASTDGYDIKLLKKRFEVKEKSNDQKNGEVKTA